MFEVIISPLSLQTNKKRKKTAKKKHGKVDLNLTLFITTFETNTTWDPKSKKKDTHHQQHFSLERKGINVTS